jgi:hypothetical protein
MSLCSAGLRWSFGLPIAATTRWNSIAFNVSFSFGLAAISAQRASRYSCTPSGGTFFSVVAMNRRNSVICAGWSKSWDMISPAPGRIPAPSE